VKKRILRFGASAANTVVTLKIAEKKREEVLGNIGILIIKDPLQLSSNPLFKHVSTS
jgi:hypothetical protein